MYVFNNFSVMITRSLRESLKKKKALQEALNRVVGKRGASASAVKDGGPQLNMQKCLIVSKVTRYEYEQHTFKDPSPERLERALRKRGSDYDALLANHRQQKAFETEVARRLQDMGLEVKVASRLTYNDDLIKWCDVVVPCGGDGTFLLAASRVRDANKPVIGFNSAPHKSVGRLCLPTWCSHDIRGALKALKEGRFSWMRRTRIRTTLTSEQKMLDAIAPLDLHTLQFSRYPAVREEPDCSDSPTECPPQCPAPHPAAPELPRKVLPFLALNEVFIGESVTSRVSLLRLQIDKGRWTQTKSSGLCVTTGTGSTSWHFSINCLRTHSVQELMNTLSEELGVRLDTSLEKAREVAERYNQKLMFAPGLSINCLRTHSVQQLMNTLSDELGVRLDTSLEKAREVAERYNQKLMFAPDSDKLAYSVREYITFEDWPTPKGLRVRDFASAVRVKSHCIDAGLVIDGSVSFPFNDGTEALLEVHPEDALMTVHMDECLPHH